MTLRTTRMAMLALVGALALSQTLPVYTQQTVPGISKPVVVVSGDITSSANWTSNFIYVLRGAVFVEEGATLNIQAGTLIVGESGSTGTLIIKRGGKINALGTREAPIVFTSDQAVGERARGDWGGLIINGRAPVNLVGGEGEGEADTGVYGGNDANDNSGVMRYVRVEFAGTEFSPDNELNGIAFQGVGRGSQFDYIQVHMNKDDGVEFFGGSTDIKHVVLTNIGDDSLDWTFGWNGRVQYVVTSQRGDDADAGIEADNNEFNNELLPRANPTIYNVTFCGDPDTNEGSESTRGWLLRRGTAGTLRNFIVTGFKNVGLEVNGTTTLNQANARALQVSNGVFYRNRAIVAPTLTLIQNGTFPNVRLDVDPGIGDCFNHTAPNWRPTSVATLAGGQLTPAVPPNDGFFDVTTFIGGVGPNDGDDWVSGWTAFPQR